MKKNGYKVIAAIGITLAVVAVGFGVFSLVQNAKQFIPGKMLSEIKSEDQAKITVIEIKGPVSSFKASGIWEGSIEFDSSLDKPELLLTLPNSIDPQSAWQMVDGTLILSAPKESIGGRFVLKIKPINLIDLDLTGDIQFKNIKNQSLAIKLSGIGALEGNSMSLESLSISGNWLGDIDFSDLESKLMEFDLQITGKADFGRIETAKGLIKGLGEISFDKIDNQSALIVQGFFNN